jgi:hypothetical protein
MNRLWVQDLGPISITPFSGYCDQWYYSIRYLGQVSIDICQEMKSVDTFKLRLFKHNVYTLVLF